VKTLSATFGLELSIKMNKKQKKENSEADMTTTRLTLSFPKIVLRIQTSNPKLWINFREELEGTF